MKYLFPLLLLIPGNAFAIFSNAPAIGDPGKTFAEIIEMKTGEFAIIDIDNDGEVSQKEFSDYLSELMEKADTNNDGRLGANEILYFSE